MSGRIRRIADDALEAVVASPAEAHRVAGATRRPPGVLDVWPGLDRVCVLFDALRIAAADVEAILAAALDAPFAEEFSEANEIELPVRYGGEAGPDLADVARETGLSESEVVRRHEASRCRVVLIGFQPGFAYLEGLDPTLAVPRLATPRPRTPAGSVAIAGGRAGVYPLASPGGWRVIGRTDRALFDPEAEEPFVLRPGTAVRFRSVLQ